MSMASPARRPRPAAPGQGAGRSPLRALPRPLRARRAPLAITVVVIAAAVVGLVALNVQVSQQAFRIVQLQESTRAAEVRYDALQAEVDKLKAPGRIVREAERRGMVRAGAPHVAAFSGGARPSSSPGAATSPAAPGAGRPDHDAAWAPSESARVKRFLAEP